MTTDVCDSGFLVSLKFFHDPSVRRDVHVLCLAVGLGIDSVVHRV